MNFNPNKIYVADINKATNYRGRDTDFEYATYNSKLTIKDCLVIKVGEDLYVPYFYFNGLLNRLSILFALRTGKFEQSDKFMSKRPNANTKELYFLSNIRKLTLKKSKISKSELNAIQYSYDAKNMEAEDFIDSNTDTVTD